MANTLSHILGICTLNLLGSKLNPSFEERDVYFTRVLCEVALERGAVLKSDLLHDQKHNQSSLTQVSMSSSVS